MKVNPDIYLHANLVLKTNKTSFICLFIKLVADFSADFHRYRLSFTHL